MKVYYDGDVDMMPLLKKRVTVVGYGSQGRAQALNLKDSGVAVRVAVREGKSSELATSDGLETMPLERATEGEVLAFLVPDGAQPALYESFVRPGLRDQTLLFSHGFNVHYGYLKAPAGCDVVMVAPKAPGRMVREVYTRGGGVPCLTAVQQDASGTAWPTTLAYAKALGGTRAGVIETTFKEETETDLFGEQAVLCGGMTELVVAGFETLVQAGYQPEVAYFECVHELKLIVDLMWEGGLARMHEFVSDTAKYGDLTRGPRVVDARVRESMRQLLREVQDGSFAKEWMAEVKAGKPKFKTLLQEDLNHQVETVGRQLRGMMRGGGPVNAEVRRTSASRRPARRGTGHASEKVLAEAGRPRASIAEAKSSR